MANKGRGGGVENPTYYENVQYMFLNIQNIHAMRAALTKVFEACFPRPEDGRWLKALADSKWLYHIKQIIFAATSVADKASFFCTQLNFYLFICLYSHQKSPKLTNRAFSS